MEKVVRVSIANLAFILEEEAYGIINSYLEELQIHYSNHENGSEIIDGIEERIADLFAERITGGSVVPVATVKEVINLLGRPSDIDREAGGEPEVSRKRTIKKKLYRDPDRRIFGGVCGGLGAYFNIDVVLVRLIFIVIFLFCAVLPVVKVSSGLVLLAYVILWIITPKARTVEQKYAMRGEAFSVSGIERNAGGGIGAHTGSPNPFWKGVGRVVAFCVGILLAACGISGLVGFMVAFSGFHFFHNSFGELLQVLLNQSATTSFLLKSALLLTVFLPFIGMLYGGIQLLFGFRSPKWRPGLMIFLLWIVALLTTVSLSFYSSARYFDSQHLSQQQTIETRDTIYIKYDKLDDWNNDRLVIDAGRWNYNFALLDNDGKDKVQMITYPNIYLSRDTANNDFTLRSGTLLFNNLVKGNELKKVMDMRFYRMEGDTLYLDPLVYNRENTVKEAGRRVRLCIRPETKVIIDKPVPHHFDKDFSHNNWLGWLPY